jgi:hypothetical protein
MKTIKLTKGKEAIIDKKNYEHFMKCKWSYSGNGYAIRRLTIAERNLKQIKCKHVGMHREVLELMGFKNFQDSEHINFNKLDNRESNLRIATRSQNIAHRPKFNGCVSIYKGVSWQNDKQIWRARIAPNRKEIFLGTFKCEEDAAKAYDKAALKIYGKFAVLNFPGELNVNI